MRTAMCRAALVAGLVSVMTTLPQAQQTSSSTATKSFEIIAVEGNRLVVKLPEGTRELTVPEDFRFTVDGKQLSVRELKAGMKGTAAVTTQTTVTPVTVTEVKNGTVYDKSGGSIIVQTPEGFKMFSQGDLDKRGVKIVMYGKPVVLDDLNKGDKLSATIVTSAPPKVMTRQEVQATLASPSAAPAAAPSAAASAPARPTSAPPAAATSGSGAASPAATPAAKPAAPKTLPKTATAWPLAGLLSLVSLGTGLALTVRRRFGN